MSGGNDVNAQIDKYHLNLYCLCANCRKREVSGKAYSCTAYPKEKGIPSEIWNGKNAKCPYFKEKQR